MPVSPLCPLNGQNGLNGPNRGYDFSEGGSGVGINIFDKTTNGELPLSKETKVDYLSSKSVEPPAQMSLF